MTQKTPSGLSILLSEMGMTHHGFLAGILIVALFEATIIGFAVFQALVERALRWPPIVVFVAVWLVWTWWHSWLFPRRRRFYLAHYEHPYRQAFARDIYPWVCIGFSQMWRPLLNGETLDRLWTGELRLSPVPVALGLLVCFASLFVIIIAIRTIGIHNAAFLREFVEADTFTPLRAGIYGKIMHPLFWSGIAYSCGLAISMMTTQALLMAVANIGYGFLYNRLEDHRLSGVFGASYESYRAEFVRIVPWRR